MSITRSKTEIRPDILPYGDGAFLLQFAKQDYDSAITARIQALSSALQKTDIWIEIVPGYNALLVSFNPQITKSETALQQLQSALRAPLLTPESGRQIEIPVCYSGTYGPDLKSISHVTGLSPDTIIKLHSEVPYRVCMMGFIPGFTFLSEAPKALHHPRHATPRLSVPAGSIGIAGWQTGIYGLESPGGWQLIGRTPFRIFEAHRKDPFLIKSGDSVKFIPITDSTFQDMRAQERTQKADLSC